MYKTVYSCMEKSTLKLMSIKLDVLDVVGKCLE